MKNRLKRLIIIVAIIVPLLSIGNIPMIAKASNDINGSQVYINPSEVPNEIIQGGKTYHLKSIQTINYNEPLAPFFTNHWNTWNGSDYEINSPYAYDTGFPPFTATKTVSQNGYTFTAYYHMNEYHERLTEYCAPGYPRNTGAIYNYQGDYVTVDDSTSFIGYGYLYAWEPYITSVHYWTHGWSATVYYGVYEEVLSNPNESWDSVSGQQYKSNEIYWYKLNNGGTVPTFQVAWNDPYTDIMNSYLVLTYNGSNVLRAGTDHHNSVSNGWNDLINSNYITSSSNVCEVNAGRNCQFRFQPNIIKSGIYNVYTEACNVAIRWENPSQTEGNPIDTGKSIGIDEQAPTYGNITIDDGKIDECNFSITSVKDYCDTLNTIAGSGVKEVKVALFPIADDGYRGSDIWTTGTYNEATQQVYINGKFSSHYDGIYGQYNAHIYFTDNVGNELRVAKTIMRANPNPEDVSVDLQTWDYKDPNSNKRWIKVGHTATVVIATRNNKEYSSLANGYPTNIEYKFDRYNNSNVLELIEDTYGTTSIGISSFNSNGGLSLSNATTINYSSGSYKCLKSTIQVTGQAVGHEKGYLISGTGYTLLDGMEYYYKDDSNNIKWSPEQDGEYLYVDGVAPTGSMTYKFDQFTLQFSMNANVVDTGSGVKKVYAKVVSNDPSAVRIIDLQDYGNNVYKMASTDLLSIFDDTTDKIKTVNVELWAIDNVGNESKISEVDNLDLFSLTASLEKVLEPHDNNFKCGQQGLIVAYTRGYVDRVTMTFPNELMALDNTLNTDISINPTERKKNVPYKWFVPLYAEYKTYPVVVTAYRDGKSKSVTLQFNVQDTVLDKIRTAILMPKDK